ncbi:MAG: serine--tRNA ligase [Candidatus Omnitrophica bacterium]|nr:serine--tRNA ligase [Candidatus Omnitrophota bacterium]
MLDIKLIRENQDVVRQSLKDRNNSFDLDNVLKVDESRRAVLSELEELRAKRNRVNDEISALLKQKKDAQGAIGSMKEVSRSIDELEARLRAMQSGLDALLLRIPNVPHESVPRGNASANHTLRSWGEPPPHSFKPKTHLDLCRELDIIDFPRATKITGSNWVLYKGWGARLERALINFMLDLHTSEHGYTEIFPPFLVNRDSMTGTGQLPKLEEDMYRLKDDDLFLIPTAEVPLTNIFRDEIIDDARLPIYYTAYSACFRREAGSYGKDTKGLMRVHQFDKVEMVKFVRPESSYDELEKLLADAERVLQALGLPYRVIVLATGDISFAASKCYDIEAYASGSGRWLEVSSCSNFESFQARRAGIRFRRKTEDGKQKTEHLHTLNGSGVALARTMIALLENYQQEDGSVLIPEVLRPYLNGTEKITPAA